MVTAEQVWDALAEIPDPEIPVISLVDLGVVRDVAVEDGRVRVEFTPTFLGCPALEVMRDQMATKVRELRRRAGGGGDLGRLVVDRPHRPRTREAASSGFAPPAPREPGGPQLVQLQSGAFRCLCGSTDTLENLFGPTPCRSLLLQRLRQPFEQFKTI